MRTVSILLWIGVTAACAQDLSFVRPNSLIHTPAAGRCPAPGAAASCRAAIPANRNLWRASVAALATANALDIHSSWGKRELNQALAGRAGNFGREGALVKSALQGGLLAFECMLVRHRPTGTLYRVLSVVNFGAAAAVSGVAAHNYRIPRVP